MLTFATRPESRPKDAVIAFFNFSVVGDDVVRIVGQICHVNHNNVPVNCVQPGTNRSTKPARRHSIDQSDRRVFCDQSFHNVSRLVRTVVINDDNFVIETFSHSDDVLQFLHACGDIASFVASRNYDGQFHVVTPCKQGHARTASS